MSAAGTATSHAGTRRPLPDVVGAETDRRLQSLPPFMSQPSASRPRTSQHHRMAAVAARNVMRSWTDCAASMDNASDTGTTLDIAAVAPGPASCPDFVHRLHSANPDEPLKVLVIYDGDGIDDTRPFQRNLLYQFQRPTTVIGDRWWLFRVGEARERLSALK